MNKQLLREQEVAEGESIIETNQEYLKNLKFKKAEQKREIRKEVEEEMLKSVQIERRSVIEAANQLHKNKISN